MTRSATPARHESARRFLAPAWMGLLAGLWFGPAAANGPPGIDFGGVVPERTPFEAIQAERAAPAVAAGPLDGYLRQQFRSLDTAAQRRLALQGMRQLLALRGITDEATAQPLLDRLFEALGEVKAGQRKALLAQLNTVATALSKAEAILDERVLAALESAPLRRFLQDALSLPDDPLKLLVQQDPFEATDIDMLQPEAYGGVRYPAAAPGQIYTYPADPNEQEAALRTRVSKTLEQRKKYLRKHPEEPDREGIKTLVADGLAVYDEPQIKAVVPDPRLRASLAMLFRTPGRKAIEAIQSGAFREVIWETPRIPTWAADSKVNDDGSHTIRFNPIYQNEDPRELASSMAHETIHQNLPGGGGGKNRPEEVVANTVENLVRAKFWREDPTLALQQTDLIQKGNTELMALMNCRDESGKVSEYGSGKWLFPGKPEWGTSYSGHYQPYESPSQPGHQTLFDTMRFITGLNEPQLLAKLQENDPQRDRSHGHQVRRQHHQGARRIHGRTDYSHLGNAEIGTGLEAESAVGSAAGQCLAGKKTVISMQNGSAPKGLPFLPARPDCNRQQRQRACSVRLSKHQRSRCFEL